MIETTLVPGLDRFPLELRNPASADGLAPSNEPLPDQLSGFQTDALKPLLHRWLDWRKEKQGQNLAKVLGACRSPIERSMLLGLLCVATRWVDGIVYEFADRSVVSDGDTSSNSLTIAPQKRIEPYTVDFELTWRQTTLVSSRRVIAGKLEELVSLREYVARCIVECDGHDYHERTAEQALRDRERDRAMQRRGYEVMRFTGREIFRDAVGCAAQVKAGMSPPK